ncbi:gp26 [Sodalis phage phiSG1]|uniref:ProP protein n=1 Tax=Sodalis glossinidius TaxID=63612 RepID=Q4LBS4_SODGL|nr:ProQ/FINO family protein [Sodalis glossinidius]YP_516208.1 ProQ/FinO family protein [Sodalis phage phiSG1]ABN42233.1 gp26 [Sodalis phage phiSG1]BAE80493.1 ProP protein [Sodalis phage phiSG1]CAI59410.1 ProP protein [Sodalis glossinidius]
MTEQKRPLLSIKRKPKIFVNPKHSSKPAPSPTKPAKPLKIGIAADIYQDIKGRELGLTRAKASAALMFYTQTRAYQEAVQVGDSRFDINGQPCGEITEEQKAHAAKQLENLKAAL